VLSPALKTKISQSIYLSFHSNMFQNPIKNPAIMQACRGKIVGFMEI